MSEGTKNQVAPGELLVHSLFRLLQVVRIHQANNSIFQTGLAEFRTSLGNIWSLNAAASLRLSRGRFYLNESRVIYSSNMWATAGKLIEFIQGLRLAGLSFKRRDDLADGEIIDLLVLLNQARRQENPVDWLKERGAVQCPWVEFLEDEDSGLAFVASPSDSSAGSPMGPGSVLRRPQAQAAGRRAYAHALTVFLGLTDKLNAHKKAGLQKVKRALQELIEILETDENVILILSTIRSYGDLLNTHSLNVALLALALGRRLGLPLGELEYLGLSGLFHDLGKLGLPPGLLQRAAPLSEGERAAVQGHVLESVRRLISLNANHRLKGRLLRPAFEHHLGCDLAGYPRPAGRSPLSLFSRIIAVADRYDALTSSRPYRAAPLSPDQALRHLAAEVGPTLDPHVFKLFLGLVGPWPVGTLLLLDDGRTALAAGTGPEGDAEGRPWARLIFQQEGRIAAGDYLNLAERDEGADFYRRQILAAFHPSQYGLQPADLLL